jgi:hypothetical protein
MPPGCLIVSADGVVEKPFPETVRLPEKAREISEFYVLYMVKIGRNTIITAVQPADANSPQKFDRYEGFSVK